MKQKMTMILIVVCSLLLVSFSASAKRDKFYPRGCSPKTVMFHGNQIALGTKPTDRTYRVYVFKNVSSQTIKLVHPATGRDLGLGLNSDIRPHTWSAIIVHEENFPLLCQENYQGYESGIACEDVIRACEMAVSPVMQSSKGEYWITESQPSKSALFRGIRSQGIYP